MTGEWLKSKMAPAILLALSLAVLPGCSLARFGYVHLDTIAVWVADEYFDFDSDQRREFVTRFDRLHEWHRYEQLPEYAMFLDEMKARMQKGLQPEDVTWFIEGVRERYRVVVRRSADDAAAVLATVTPEQLDALRRRWERDNRRFVHEYELAENFEEQRRAAARRAVSRIRDWTRSLSNEQEQRITALAGDLPPIHRLRHEDRLRRQREFLELMRNRADTREFASRLRHWLLHWEEGRDPQYDKHFADWTRKQADFYVAVDRMLTPQQRAAVLRRMQGYRDDFAQLSERPAARAAASR